jgi:hypothetical protein
MKTIDQQLRIFEIATWKHANSKCYKSTCIYDAGKLGFCMLTWTNGKWENQWLARTKIPPKFLRLAEKTFASYSREM